MSHSVRSDRGSSRRSSTTSDFSESDFKRLEELRDIGKNAKNEARDLDIESMPDSMMSSASTALTKAERKRQLAIAKTHKLILTRKPREILKEEEYLSDIDKLITRDFFPHYDHVKDQHDYLLAEEEGDVEAMREIQMKHKKRQAERPTTGAWTVGGTPFLEGTPAPDDRSPGRENDDHDDPEEDQEKHAPVKKKSRTENISLDRYCTKFTSEDNDSFQKVHKFTEDKKKEQYAFLHAAQEQGDRMCEDKDANKLMAPEKILAIEDSRDPGKQKKSGVGNWKYTNKNSLFYGAELEAQKEYIFKKPPQPREIVHENTRFKKDPFLRPVAPDRVQTLVHNRIKNTLKDEGKVGIDGKQIIPGRYGLLATPSPMPGVEDSPFMTWGQLEATPQRAMTPNGAGPSEKKVPGVSTVASNAPAFRMDSMNEREELAHRLTDSAFSARRNAKEKTLSGAKKSAFGTTPHRLGKSMGKTPEMRSPALNRLLSKHTNKLGIGNSSLRASLTPSPSVRRGGQTPGSRRAGGSVTPRTPKTSGFGSKTIAGVKIKSNSVTDGLI